MVYRDARPKLIVKHKWSRIIFGVSYVIELERTRVCVLFEARTAFGFACVFNDDDDDDDNDTLHRNKRKRISNQNETITIKNAHIFLSLSLDFFPFSLQRNGMGYFFEMILVSLTFCCTFEIQLVSWIHTLYETSCLSNSLLCRFRSKVSFELTFDSNITVMNLHGKIPMNIILIHLGFFHRFFIFFFFVCLEN